METPHGYDNSKNSAGAIGPYQITYAYWLDASVTGSHSQCDDKDYAELVVKAYFDRYAPGWRDGRYSVKHLAMIHRGGPKGYQREEFTDYGNRAQNIYKSQARESYLLTRKD